MVEDHQGSFAQVVGIPVGTIVAEGIVGADTERQVDQKMQVVEHRAVSKQPRVVCKVLVKMIRNPHLVNHYTWLVEQHKETHSGVESAQGYPEKKV
jgi:hypothetical protein